MLPYNSMYCSTGVQARSASCRAPCGSTGMQGGLRRGAHGTVLLGKVCYGRAWCIGEGMQEGHALILLQKLRVFMGRLSLTCIVSIVIY